jgi:hypothetical protein
MHGYQIMQAMSDLSGGAWHPSSGAIYPTIAELEDDAAQLEAARQILAQARRPLYFILAGQAEDLWPDPNDRTPAGRRRLGNCPGVLVFTERFGNFKPPEHNLLSAPIAETLFEPRVGGHIFDRVVDGTEYRWARILVYEPPVRGCLQLGYQP